MSIFLSKNISSCFSRFLSVTNRLLTSSISVRNCCFSFRNFSSRRFSSFLSVSRRMFSLNSQAFSSFSSSAEPSTRIRSKSCPVFVFSSKIPIVFSSCLLITIIEVITYQQQQTDNDQCNQIMMCKKKHK